jgi:hypothetical protein
MKDNRNMNKIGSFSGMEYGQITKVGVNSNAGCIDWSGHGFKYNNDSVKGDSGGPVCSPGKVNPENAVLAGIHSVGSDFFFPSKYECDREKKPNGKALGFYKMNNDYGTTPV